MSLDNFIRTADRLVEFEAAFNDSQFPVTSIHSIEIHKDELKSSWSKLKEAYEKCLCDIENVSGDDDNTKESVDLESVKEKYKSAYITYCRIVTKLSELVQELSSKAVIPTTSQNHGVNLPTCKIPIFDSEYDNWPTFRDLFTAVCIKNPRLSAIEKLVFLTEKTSGDAFDIVSRCPLTNEGFTIAWKDLNSRFENKKVLVNVQLRKLFSLKPIVSESASALKTLQRDINACITNLRQLEISLESWDPIFVYLCTDCLPHITLTEWEHTLPNKTTIAKWLELDAFLTGYYGTLEAVELKKYCSSKPSTSKSNQISKPKSSANNVKSFQTMVTPSKCKLCPSESHIIRKCPRFLNMSVSDKFSEIKNSNLCINCFSGSHSVKNCTSKHSCYKCNKRHNTLLHKDSEPFKANTQNRQSPGTTNSNLRTAATPFQHQSQSNSDNALQSTSSGNGIVRTYCSTGSRGVLLGTAVVKVYHRGDTYSARVLLDSGSEGTLISGKFFNMLKLPYENTSAQIAGVGDSVTADVTKECFFALGSYTDDNIRISASALVVPRLCGNIPSSTVDISSLSGIRRLKLADPRFNESAKIDILIGGDLLPSIMLQGIKLQICGSLMAQETVFGWAITGPIPVQPSSSFLSCVAMFCEISLDKEISRFWEVEDLPRKNYLSQSDQYCEDLYIRTTTRNSEGRFIVSLPFKDGYPEKLNIGQSRAYSIAQYFRNENRLVRTPDFKNEYDKVLQEYISLGHMVQVSPPSPSNRPFHYYLPHHAVIKPESTTTKVRVVFNASSSTSNGLSLNDILHTGPVLQNDLTILILKWRFFRYVFNGDIQKMYRQILVNPSQTAFQRIIFRKTPNDSIQDYELKTVTFGVNCAPYLAIRTIIQLAKEVEFEYPLASHVLKNSMYVDDALAGAHTLPIAIKTRDELILALNSAGFSMRKWTANTKDMLSGLPTDHLLNEDFLQFDDSSTAKTLGIRWNARFDCFYFSVTPFPEACRYTKREVLSQISKLFDPAGWLAPCIILAKILMQRVWIERTDWDEVLSQESLLKWKNFQLNYPSINSIKIPRWVNFTPNSEVQFHGFSDASEKAYAAALYIRICNGSSISTHLIASKTKVSPIKTLSIPRLELCGAVLLVEMLDSILPRLEVDTYTTFCWTDSTIVLSWLAKPPCFWTTFVANRVSKITQIMDTTRWRHVDSESNPADLASRGVPPQDLIDNDLWWNGPQWLRESSEKWHNLNIPSNKETELEKKPIKINFSHFHDFEDILERFSSLPKAFRVVSYIYRFYYRTHPKYRHSFYKDSEVITASEILMVRNKLISVCQRANYPNDYMALSTGKSLSASSPILSLNPFLDDEKILRSCGRLTSSPELSYNEKHPVILPYNCQFSRLLVRFIHQISLHGGNQLVLRLIRTNYWIPKVKNLIKSTINKCKPCILYKRRCQSQIMAALPPERSQLTRPFAHTGLDFAGPFDIKNYSGRACRITKGYVCVFVCFSTKAIHLEATSDLSTPAFLAAFSRFVSRRGCPLHLHSDNGTTFIGASKILAKEFIQTSQQAVTSNYGHQNLTWHFIPPGAPHMGGLWEAGVKSFKAHLRKHASVAKYTFEEFQTLLSRIEACLNSRPLSPISQDPSDLTALTPGHFLIGTPILAPIDPHINEAPMSICNRWQRLKVVYQNFCARWKNEYLSELHKRHKWKKPEEDVKENMLVVIKEENLPPNSWRLGRISKVYSGVDNRVRVADILTQRGTITRPITKLIVLPIDS